jgi:hypothetical protein
VLLDDAGRAYLADFGLSRQLNLITFNFAYQLTKPPMMVCHSRPSVVCLPSIAVSCRLVLCGV